jgi:hypothetical protein
MPNRSVEDVRRELASERESLTEAVEELREEGGKLRSKLPVVAAGALGGIILLKGGLRAAGSLLRRR